MSRHSMGEMGEDFCPNILHPLLKILTNGAKTTEAGIQLPYFTTLTEKADTLIWATARTLQYLARVSSKAAPIGREKRQVRINIQEARE